MTILIWERLCKMLSDEDESSFGILIWNDKVLIGKRKLTNQHQPENGNFPW